MKRIKTHKNLDKHCRVRHSFKHAECEGGENMAYKCYIFEVFSNLKGIVDCVMWACLQESIREQQRTVAKVTLFMCSTNHVYLSSLALLDRYNEAVICKNYFLAKMKSQHCKTSCTYKLKIRFQLGLWSLSLCRVYDIPEWPSTIRTWRLRSVP